MRPTPQKDASLFAFMAVMAVGIFFIDLSLPLGVAAGIPYIVLVLLGALHPQRSRIILLAAIATGLMVVGYYFSPSEGMSWMAITNRALSVAVIWVTAGLLAFGKGAVAARNTQEQRMRLVLQNAVNGIISINEEGTIESFNPAAERIFGYRTWEVMGRNVTFLMPEPYRSEHHTYIDNYMRTGQARIIGIGRELQGRRKDGTVFPMELGVSEAFVAGRRIFTGFVTDITQRKRSEEQLLQEKERAQQYLDIAGAIIVALDEDERVTLINAKGCELLGFSEQGLIGKNWFETCLPEEEREGTRRVFHRLIRGELELVEYHENSVAGRNGKQLRIAWHNTLLRDEHATITGTLSAGVDVTEHRKAEAQLQQALKMETVGRLTGGIAHDFNNLLAVNLANLELLKERLKDNPAELELAARAQQAGERGAALTRRLLAFSREQKLEPELTDLNALVAGMIDLSRRTLGENIDIRTELEANLGPVVVDPVQTESALLNLVINARDAIGHRPGRLTIHTSTVRLDQRAAHAQGQISPGDYVALEVSDTGEGMSAEARQRAFEPFFTTKGPGEGSGLGLSMVYGFARQSGGHVEIDPGPSSGTTVRLFLPRAPEGALPAETKQPAAPPAQGEQQTILVVEDYPELRATVVDMLEGMGYQPLPAEDARTALEVLARDTPVSLLFTDVVLPGGMGGVELCHEACKIRPGLKVLLTSGYTENVLSGVAELDGNHAMIEKPYKLNALAEKIRDLLQPPAC